MKKKILYIHGALSAFKPLTSTKIKTLQQDFDVFGLNYSLSDPFNETLQKGRELCAKHDFIGIVGSSLGGLFATQLGALVKIPTVVINPCVEPQKTLGKYIGKHQNYATQVSEHLTAELLQQYPQSILDNLQGNEANVLCYVSLNDEIIDSVNTIAMLSNRVKTRVHKEADHRWDDFSYNNEINDFLITRCGAKA